MINNHSYWENKKVTSEEKAITKYLLKLDHAKNMNILHIGIGCSYLLLNLHPKTKYKCQLKMTLNQNFEGKNPQLHLHSNRRYLQIPNSQFYKLT